MLFAKRTNKHPYSPNLFITIARKLYGDCGIEHINDIKKNSAIYIFHGVRRDKKNPSDEKHVLVKVLLSADELSKTKFENEAFYYSQFNHDHLIKKEFSRKINFGYKLGKKNCIVLEYVDGVDLELVINSMAVTKEKIPEKTAIDIIIKTLSALNEVHHLKDKKENNLNIVHADISPHNILLSKTGQVKLIDFGISVIKEKQKKIKKDIIDGKISYMSPEQILGEPIDQRTDIFSIGIVLAEMLLTTKLNPTVISSDKVRENAINAHYPAINESSLDEALKKILAKALEKDPNNRYQDALLMIKALEDYKEKNGLVSRSQDIVAVVKTIFMYLSSGKT
ncbi:MAG: serine/threonine-protein kinase, partial [bacterium]